MKRVVALPMLIFIGAFLFSSCEDPELESLMDDYCNCISLSRYDESKSEECIEKMEAIQEKYQHDLRKQMKILERTDECY